MERTIPYFRDNIVPNSINKGKRVLVASSENAIRGLLMHLCDIPVERISEVGRGGKLDSPMQGFKLAFFLGGALFCSFALLLFRLFN